MATRPRKSPAKPAADARHRIVIACQGGGSHTAFTGGVLQRLLADDDHRVVALSGTSGGAVCAYLAWSALLDGRPDARATAANRLKKYWNDVKAEPPYETLLDSLTMDTGTVRTSV